MSLGHLKSMHAPLLTLVRSGEAHSHEVPIGEDAISSPHQPPRVRECRIWTTDVFASARNPYKCCGFSYPEPKRPIMMAAKSGALIAVRKLPVERFSMNGKTSYTTGLSNSPPPASWAGCSAKLQFIPTGCAQMFPHHMPVKWM